MSEPFLAEIKIGAFAQAPKGWALANGQFLPINQNQALFSLLGINYGGNGQTTFALPNLQGRVPIHFGGAHDLAESAGQSAVTINIQSMPQHIHFLQVSPTNADTPVFSDNFMGAANNAYTSAANLVSLSPTTVTSAGGSQPHNNMMPYLVLTFIIALQGIFPSRNG